MPSEWVTKNQFDPAYLPVIQEKLYFEGDGAIRATTNYIVLLTLATIIATYGLISGSTATVIGAMIVAPLMTSIMAVTLGIILGDGPRVGRSVLIVGTSIIYVIGLAIVLSFFISPVTIGFGSNTEILGRDNPDLLALYAALASGAAGAFAVSRREIGDALPGVAIAISLVPPLCVVGICLSKAFWLSAGGAMLLFLTNFFAIVLAGGAVFWLSGVRRECGDAAVDGVCEGPAEARARRRAVVVAVVGILVIGLLLGFNGYRTLEHNRATYEAEDAVAAWLTDTKYIIRNVDLTFPPDDITVRGPASALIEVAGTGDLRPTDRLAADLKARLGYDVSIELRKIPEEIEYYPTFDRRESNGSGGG